MENIFTNIKERVIQVAEKQPISKERFFKSINMTSASFRGKAKNTPLNSNAIATIITKYPETDLYWLITGKRKEELPIVSSEVNEPSHSYGDFPNNSDEIKELISLLKSQIKDLKSDKEDLKKMVRLFNEKK